MLLNSQCLTNIPTTRMSDRKKVEHCTSHGRWYMPNLDVILFRGMANLYTKIMDIFCEPQHTGNIIS